jgi:hypothetical protein
MNLASLKAATKLTTSRSLLKVKKNSPAILMVTGIVGMVATAVTASRATLQLEPVIDELNERLARSKELQRKIADGEVAFDKGYTPEDFKRAEAIIYAKGMVRIGKLYAPSALLATASIAAIVSGHTILDRRNVVLAASYATLDKTFGRYREKVIGAFGQEKERELYEATVERTETDSEGKVTSTFQVQDPVSVYGRWFARGNKNWEFVGDNNMAFLRAQQNFLNDRLRSRGYCFLNDAYEALGMPHTPEGQIVGWIYNKDTGDDYVDFGLFLDSASNRGITAFDESGDPKYFLDFNVDGVVYDLI